MSSSKSKSKANRLLAILMTAAITLLGPTLRAETINNQQVGDLNSYGDLARIRDEVLKEYLLTRLVLSQANLIDAQARGVEVMIEHWRLINEAAARELQNLKFAEWVHNRTMMDIELKTAMIKPMRLGQLNEHVFYALDHFFQHYIPAYVVKETMSAKVDALPASNFTMNDPKSSVIEDFPGGDMGALMNFLERNKVSTKKWSQAHYQLLGMLTSLSAAAEEKIKELRLYLDSLRKGNVNVFKKGPPQ